MTISQCKSISNNSPQHATPALLWVSLLLATPSVSAFSASGTTHCTTSALRIRLPADRVRHATTDTLLYLHRDTSSEESGGQRSGGREQSRTKQNNWRQHLFPQDDHMTGSDQDKVDEYLAFLDKRYHRLHESKQPSKVQFSIRNWLTGDAGVTTDIDAINAQENALFVLGVAELASDRLLQNLQINVQLEKEKAAKQAAEAHNGVINAQFCISSILDDSLVTKTTTATLIEAGSTVISRIGARRAAFVSFQNRQIDRALRFVVKAATVGPIKVASVIWKFGGGQKSIALTLSLLTTALFLLVPLAQAVAKAVIECNQSA